jgi:hypothetical protein
MGPGVREHGEVVGAAAIFVLVLLVIDAAALLQPALTLSLLPFVFLLGAALVPLSPRRAAIWIAGIVVLAIVLRDARYVGLAVPAAIVGLLVFFHRRRTLA